MTSCVKAEVEAFIEKGYSLIVPSDCVGVRQKRLPDQDALLHQWATHK
jgi:hypothetical protein